MFTVTQLDKFTCPAGYSQMVSYNFPSGTVVSVGFQNMGNATSFWISQMFPLSSSQAYWQVVNSSGSGTDWYPYVVLYQPDGSAAFEVGNAKAESSTVPLS